VFSCASCTIKHIVPHPWNGSKAFVLCESGIANSIVAVTGIMTVPRGKAPKGGFPVVSWAHGTTGIADICAPSRSAGDAPTNDYVKNFRAEASEWIADGYAVVQTDYQGLGTKGMHPYLIGTAEGRSVIDIVRAAHAVDPRVGRRWVAVGHSQGGHAVLWAAAIAKSYAPSLRLTGAVPLAPGTHIGEQATAAIGLASNPFGGLPGLIISAALDAARIDPAVALSDKALTLLPYVEQQCLTRLSQPDSWGGLPLNEIVRDGYDPQPVLDTISANDPEDLTIKGVPLFIAQGTEDRTAFPNFTNQTVDDLRSRGAKLTYKTYDGVDHNGIVDAAAQDTGTFIHARLGER
jgi:pimeloyl-ACP methyl ester carboxylesterase